MADTKESGSSQMTAARTPEPGELEALADLVTQLQVTTESEKSALAKELHDELGGLITAAKMDMQWLTSHLAGSLDAASEEKIKSVMQMLNQAMTLKRRVVEDLRPSLLDHFGLSVALRSHFEERCRGVGMDCIASLPDESLELTRESQVALFRIAQEVLSAMMAVGKAKNVELVIEPEEGGYSMLIADDGDALGAGFDRTLLALHHRIRGIRGTLDARHESGQGNRIRTFVPRSPAKSG
jgi:signal transduction histidine kinase